jgi:hypothetical protein
VCVYVCVWGGVSVCHVSAGTEKDQNRALDLQNWS